MANNRRLQKINTRTLKNSLRLLKRSFHGLLISENFVYPHVLKIKKNETFMVTVVDECQIKFAGHDLFDDQPDIPAGFYPWTPAKDNEGEAFYTVAPITSRKKY